MKRTTLLLGGLAVLAGAAAAIVYAKRRQAIPVQAEHEENGHAQGEKMLRRALHKAKLASS